MRAKSIPSLSILASAIALCLPSSANALGLGRLTLQSALGQPLSAQIELTAATQDELDSLAARLSDPSLYRRNNLSYNPLLTRARVTVEKDAAGQPFLRVSTAAPVNEPYLDLMVEINWSAGRLVREYTFLLDPPGAVATAPVEPVAPLRVGTAARPAAPQGAPAPAPTQAQSQAAAGSQARAAPRTGEGRRAQGPAPASAPAASAPAASAPAASAPAASAPAASGPAKSDYTVRRGDSLMRIANELRPEGVALEQMLVALFRANPAAFDGENMNRLRSGSILKVPTAEETQGLAENEARRVVRMQAADWRAYRDQVAAGAPETAGAAGRGSAGRITAAVEEKTPAAAPGRDQLRVSREAGKGKGGAAPEDVVARDRALADAQARIAQLEKTLVDLQRAMEMRSQTMAAVQAQAEKGRAPEAPKAAATAPAPVAAASPAAPAAVAKSEPKPAGSAGTEPPAGSSTAVSPPVVAQAAPTPSAAPPAAPPAPRAQPKTAPKVESAAAPSMLDDLLGGTPPWVMGAGALAVVGGIAALIAARRRRSSSFEDSIISGTDIKSNTVFGSTGGGVVNTGENSLASDFSRDGLGNIDTDEVDPIAEAEVYLAYGRDAQAEEILKDALKKDPQRQEVYLKLLEIHAQHNKPSVFETVAAELYAVCQGQGEIWQKAVALGRQLDPSNPMFAAGTPAGSPVADTPVVSAPMASVEPAEPYVPAGVAEMDHLKGTDLTPEEELSLAPSGQPRADRRSVDVAEDELTASLRGGPADDGASQAKSAVSIEDRIQAARTSDPEFDLNFHLEESEKPAPISTRSSPAAAKPATKQPASLDKLDLSFESDRAPFEDPTPSVLDGQWHDAATKLDLAKAYQEMGDLEGAREILQEVVLEGDEQQKSEAGALLEKIP